MDPRWVIRSHLRRERDAWPQERSDRFGLVYRGPADFLFEHGRWWTVQPRPQGLVQGVPGACYGTAIGAAVLAGLRYVQGYAVSPVEPEDPIPHAWNADEEGCVLDLTWYPLGLVYFGVEFSAERADDATWNGDAELLDDRNRGWPLLRERWRGELPEPDPAWKPSPMLLAMRARVAGDEEEAIRQWLLGQKEARI